MVKRGSRSANKCYYLSVETLQIMVKCTKKSAGFLVKVKIRKTKKKKSMILWYLFFRQQMEIIDKEILYAELL